MNQSTATTDSPTLPWWATSAEDMTAPDGPESPDDLAWRFVAVRAEIDGPDDLEGSQVEIGVALEVERSGKQYHRPHVDVFADDARLDAAAAREVARQLLLAADVLDQIEKGANRG